jgi:PTH1 family peptidyl-tRNA hydrolase
MLLVGLGNPGAKYANNRHNIGAMALEAILQRFSFSEFKKAYKGLFSSGEVNGEKVYLLFPQTFMNLSGESVQAAASFYKIPPDRIFVFHDELDLAPGKSHLFLL